MIYSIGIYGLSKYLHVHPIKIGRSSGNNWVCISKLQHVCLVIPSTSDRPHCTGLTKRGTHSGYLNSRYIDEVCLDSSDFNISLSAVGRRINVMILQKIRQIKDTILKDAL